MRGARARIAAIASRGSALAATSATGEPMRFRLATSGGNCGVCTWIAAEGEIQPDGAEPLNAYLVRDIT